MAKVKLVNGYRNAIMLVLYALDGRAFLDYNRKICIALPFNYAAITGFDAVKPFGRDVEVVFSLADGTIQRGRVDLRSERIVWDYTGKWPTS